MALFQKNILKKKKKNTVSVFFHKRHILPKAVCPVLFILLFFLNNAISQNHFQLNIEPLDKEFLFFKKNNIAYQTRLADSLSVIYELENILQQLFLQSYFEASFDSLHFKDSTATAFLHIGKAYKWAGLQNGNVDKIFLEKSGFREKIYANKKLHPAEIKKLKERIVEQAENNGYPFAAVFLDSIYFDKNNVEAKIFLEKGRAVFFDSLSRKGSAKISENYLRNYLGIQAGDPYSRKKILQIRTRIRELPFLKEKQNATVRFTDGKANVQLYLEKKQASRFDFLLGLLPANNRLEKKLQITGTFNAELQNQFGFGERLSVSFERLRPQTQQLKMALAWPYLFDLPFGTDGRFDIYKRDTTYTDVIGEAGIQYLLEGGNYLKAFWKTATTNLLSVDTAAIRQGRTPNVLDVKNNSFGLEAGWQNPDYRFNPRNGWYVLGRGSVGMRQILKNQAILNADESFYDTLPGSVFNFNLEATVERYFPIMERSTLKTGVRSGAVISDGGVFQNEQFRIGGNRLLRGFDEESIFATFFAVFTLEYRLLVGPNSYLYAFTDYAYIEDRPPGKPLRTDHPLGFGAGLTFETGAGVFGISVAAGKTDGAPADFTNPKIHFGYVSIF